MTTREAAKVIGCSLSHVHTLIRAGKLRAGTVKSGNNQYGYIYSIRPEEARRYRDAELDPRGWPRGRKRSK